MQKQSILFIGYGKVASRVAERFAAGYQVWAMARSQRETGSDIHYVQADVTHPVELLDRLPAGPDIVVCCLSPGRRDEAAYRATFVEGLKNVLTALQTGPLPKRLFFVSSTSVYHQDDGGAVDEGSPTRPVSFAGRILLEAENIVSECPINSTCVRFSGIYGGTRSRLIEQVLSGSRKLAPGKHITNRIHEDDCVGFLQHLIERALQGAELEDCYLASDSCPAEMNAVLTFIAEQRGRALAHSDQPAPRRAGNKRCDNRRMLASGYRLRYPSYKEGYRFI